MNTPSLTLSSFLQQTQVTLDVSDDLLTLDTHHATINNSRHTHIHICALSLLPSPLTLAQVSCTRIRVKERWQSLRWTPGFQDEEDLGTGCELSPGHRMTASCLAALSSGLRHLSSPPCLTNLSTLFQAPAGSVRLRKDEKDGQSTHLRHAAALSPTV